MADAALAQLLASIQQPLDDIAVPVVSMVGFDTLPAADQEGIRATISILIVLFHFFLQLVRRNDYATISTFGDAARGHLYALIPSISAANPAAFSAMTKRGHIPAPEFQARITADAAITCAVEWGPPEGAVRDMLSVCAMSFLVWLGGPLAAAMLDFIHSFASTGTTWSTAWAMCPVDPSALGVHDAPSRATALLARGAHASSAHVVAALANTIRPALNQIVEAFFVNLVLLQEPGDTYLVAANPPPTLGLVAAAVAYQYAAAALQSTTQVSTSPLPTSSSLTLYVPNFIDDPNPSWIRTAEYFFSHLIFPFNDAVRGDASAERHWHQYVCEVLRNRALCSKLSESQVIKHLSKTFPPDAVHFQTAREQSEVPGCTVRTWLDTIRDFFFTNGQFRFHIETAWSKYRASAAVDFNDLIHHIRIYYQLIFLDYESLPGKMSLQDFAWHLFDKLRFLMSSDCASSLSITIKSFMPLPELLAQLSSQLEQAHTWAPQRADDSAHAFVVWCIDRLNTAKSTANTAMRYSIPTQQHHGIDFASTAAQTTNASQPTQSQPLHRGIPQVTMAYTHSPAPSAGSASRGSAPTHFPERLSHVQTANPRNGGQARNAPHARQPQPRGHHGIPDPIPGFYAALNSSFKARNAFVRDNIDHPSFPAAVSAIYRLEQAKRMRGQVNTSIHGLCRSAKSVRYALPWSPEAVAWFFLDAHFLHPNSKLCGFCPGDTPPNARCHTLAHCPTAKRHAAVFTEFAADPGNQGVAMCAGGSLAGASPPPPPPATTVASAADQTPTRKRYDSGLDSQLPKRTRNSLQSPHHIR